MTDFGRSGFTVSPLTLGTKTFGAGLWGSGMAAEREIADGYVLAGGNVVDTANVYSSGERERMLGQILTDSSLGDRIILSIKSGFARAQGHPLHGGNGAIIRLEIEVSLRRVETDRIDLYRVHVGDRATPPEEVLKILFAAVTRGEILYCGLAITPAWYVGNVATLGGCAGGFRRVDAYEGPSLGAVEGDEQVLAVILVCPLRRYFTSTCT